MIQIKQFPLPFKIHNNCRQQYSMFLHLIKSYEELEDFYKNHNNLWGPKSLIGHLIDLNHFDTYICKLVTWCTCHKYTRSEFVAMHLLELMLSKNLDTYQIKHYLGAFTDSIRLLTPTIMKVKIDQKFINCINDFLTTYRSTILKQIKEQINPVTIIREFDTKFNDVYSSLLNITNFN